VSETGTFVMLTGAALVHCFGQLGRTPAGSPFWHSRFRVVLVGLRRMVLLGHPEYGRG
jgi:hypothetical protein